jgi:hypothetical protein
MTPKEIHDLIENLSEKDDAQLGAWALQLTRRKRAVAEDLYNSTLVAILAQTYAWKEGVPFRAHAYWVMRTIYTEWLRDPENAAVPLADEPDVEEQADKSDPLTVGLEDEVYEAVLKRLPPDSFTRDLWEAMYMKGANAIAKQCELLGLDSRGRIDNARKVIKRVAREVFEEFGLTFREGPHQGRVRHGTK